VTVIVAVKWNCLDTTILFWMLRLLLVATESVFTASTMRARGLAMKIISSLEQSKSQHFFKNSITCIHKEVSKKNFFTKFVRKIFSSSVSSNTQTHC